MTEPLHFYGTQISTYMRIVSMVAEEKGAAYEVHPTDPKSAEHRKRHPFGRSPALEWQSPEGPVSLFESAAIGQFIDDTFGDPGLLQTQDPLTRAHMRRWIGMVDQYYFPVFEHEFFQPVLIARLTGQEPDLERARRALGPMGLLLDVVERELEAKPWLAGTQFSMADLWLGSALEPFRLTNATHALITGRTNLSAWFDQIAARPSFAATEPKFDEI